MNWTARSHSPGALAAALLWFTAAPVLARTRGPGPVLRSLTAPVVIDGGLAARFRAEEARLLREKNQAAHAQAARLALAGKPGEALSILEPLAAASPEDLAARNALGAVYCDHKDYHKAREQFGFVAGRRSDAVWNWCLGRTLLGLGDLEGARGALDRSLSDGPDKNFGRDFKAEARAKLAALNAHLAHTKAAGERNAAGDLEGAVAEAEAAVSALETENAKARLQELRARLKDEGEAARERLLAMAGYVIGTLALAALVGYAWRTVSVRRAVAKAPNASPEASPRRPSSGEAVQSAFRPRTEAELIEALRTGKAEAVAKEYARAGMSSELLKGVKLLSPREPRAAPRYARALLRAGDYDAAHELWKQCAPAGEDGKAFSAIDREVRLRRGGGLFSGQQAYGERLSLANVFGGLGLHEESLAMLNEEVLSAAGREEMDAGAVAEHFAKAGKPALLVERAAVKERRPEFYTHFANALHVWGSHEAGLALLMKKQALGWEGQDFPLLIGFHRSLGILEKLDPKTLPSPERVLLAEGFLEEGKPQGALDVLGGVAKPAWRAREYLAAMRSLGKLERYPQASILYGEVERVAPVGQAPEVHYYFAVLCERAGRFDRAKAVYKAILAARAGYKDVQERLRNVEAIPAEETSRVTTMFATVSKLGQTPADAAAFLKGLD